VRTTLSGTLAGISASISRVTVTFEPTSPTRCVINSSAILPASRPTRAESSVTVPWYLFGFGGCAGFGASGAVRASPALGSGELSELPNGGAGGASSASICWRATSGFTRSPVSGVADVDLAGSVAANGRLYK
jgi:hypothetical protein